MSVQTFVINLVRLAITGDDTLDLVFSDGSAAHWSAADLIARDTVMTRPLADPAYFARAFIEAARWLGRTAPNCPPTRCISVWQPRTC